MSQGLLKTTDSQKEFILHKQHVQEVRVRLERFLQPGGKSPQAHYENKQALLDLMANHNRLFPPIHTAVNLGSVEAVRQCIKQGMGITTQDFDGTTPLSQAVSLICVDYMEHLELNANMLGIIQLLLDAGADPNTEHGKDNPIIFSCLLSHFLPVLEALLNAGADPNVRNSVGHTPLYHAILEGRSVEVVKKLFAAGADPNALDERVDKDVREFVQLLPDGRELEPIFTAIMILDNFLYEPTHETRGALLERMVTLDASLKTTIKARATNFLSKSPEKLLEISNVVRVADDAVTLEHIFPLNVPSLKSLAAIAARQIEGLDEFAYTTPLAVKKLIVNPLGLLTECQFGIEYSKLFGDDIETELDILGEDKSGGESSTAASDGS